MIAQMAFLAGVGEDQGVVMEIFATSSYLGMTLLPFLAGIIVSGLGYPAAFLGAIFLSMTVTFTIGRCTAPERISP